MDIYNKIPRLSILCLGDKNRPLIGAEIAKGVSTSYMSFTNTIKFLEKEGIIDRILIGRNKTNTLTEKGKLIYQALKIIRENDISI